MTWIPSRFLVSANARPRDAPHWGNGGSFHYNCHLQTYLNFRVEHLWFAARLLFSLVCRSCHRRSRCDLLISFVVTITFYRWTCQLACSVFFFLFCILHICTELLLNKNGTKQSLQGSFFFFFFLGDFIINFGTVCHRIAVYGLFVSTSPQLLWLLEGFR